MNPSRPMGLKQAKKESSDGSRQAGRKRAEGVAAVPGHHDLRAAVRRTDVVRDHGPGRRGRDQLLRHRRRLSAGRRPQPQRQDRGDHRPLAEGQARRLHPGHQVLRAHGRAPVPGREQPAAHPERRRGVAEASGDRLHRSLPAARLRCVDAGGRDVGGAGPARALGQGPLHRLLQLAGLAAGPRHRPQRSEEPGDLRFGPASRCAWTRVWA
jgi:hypothetical protein